MYECLNRVRAMPLLQLIWQQKENSAAPAALVLQTRINLKQKRSKKAGPSCLSDKVKKKAPIIEIGIIIIERRSGSVAGTFIQQSAGWIHQEHPEGPFAK